MELSLKDKSTIQRMLGKIEGVAFVVEDKIATLLLDAIEVIDCILDRPEDKAMRLIDADAYLFRCETCRSNSSGGCDTWCEHGESYRPDIKKIPTINPEELRPKGEWEWTEKGEADYEQYWVCSCCGEKDYIEENYCPNCGAKMEGE